MLVPFLFIQHHFFSLFFIILFIFIYFYPHYKGENKLLWFKFILLFLVGLFEVCVYEFYHSHPPIIFLIYAFFILFFILIIHFFLTCLDHYI